MNEVFKIALVKEKLRQLLSKKWMGPAVILIAIAVKIIQQIYFFNTRSDMTYQVLGMHHLLEGHGISLASLSIADISSVNYNPLNQWPPGFSLLLTPFYLLCGKNYIAAALTLGIACAILLIFVTRGILKLCSVPYHLVNLFTLATGFFSYYFYTIPCTDAAGISFLLTAFYFALKILKKEKTGKSDLLLLCLSLILSGFIKYLFVPVVFVIPVFLFVKGLMNKASPLKRAGLYSFMVLLLVFGAFFLWQKTATGTTGYIKEVQRGFYPENLEASFPFVPGAFIRPDSLLALLGQESAAWKITFEILQVITLVLFVTAALLLLKWFLKNRLKNISTAGDFAFLSFKVSAIIVLLLVFLSLRVGKETFDFGKWTYVQEPRYYGTIIVFIHLAVFIFYVQKKIWSSSKRTLLLGLFLLLWLPEVVRGLYFTANRVAKLGKETYGWQQELGFQKAADAVIRRIELQQPGKTIVLAGNSDWMILRVSLFSHLAAFTNTDMLLKPEEIKSSKPAILLTMIAEDKKDIYKSFISLNGVKEEGSTNGFLFYSFPVIP